MLSRNKLWQCLLVALFALLNLSQPTRSFAQEGVWASKGPEGAGQL